MTLASQLDHTSLVLASFFLEPDARPRPSLLLLYFVGPGLRSVFYAGYAARLVVSRLLEAPAQTVAAGAVGAVAAAPRNFVLSSDVGFWSSVSLLATASLLNLWWPEFPRFRSNDNYDDNDDNNDDDEADAADPDADAEAEAEAQQSSSGSSGSDSRSQNASSASSGPFKTAFNPQATNPPSQPSQSQSQSQSRQDASSASTSSNEHAPSGSTGKASKPTKTNTSKDNQTNDGTRKSKQRRNRPKTRPYPPQSWSSYASEKLGWSGSWWVGTGDGTFWAIVGHNGPSGKTIVPTSIIETFVVSPDDQPPSTVKVEEL